MKVILSMHNLKRTRAIENHVIKCIEKLDHKDRFAIDARVMLEFDKTKAPERQFKCSMRLSVPGPEPTAPGALFSEVRELLAALPRPSRVIVVGGGDNRPEARKRAHILHDMVASAAGRVRPRPGSIESSGVRMTPDKKL